MILAAHLLLFGIGSSTYDFHRTYTVGAVDVYTYEYTDTNHTNNPLMGVLTLTVRATRASTGTAIVDEVVSAGRGHPPVRNQNPSDPSVNVSTEVEMNAFGNPTWSGNEVPSKNPLDLMNLGMTALRSGLNMGQPTPFSVKTTGGSTQATFAGQVTLTAVTPVPNSTSLAIWHGARVAHRSRTSMGISRSTRRVRKSSTYRFRRTLAQEP